MTGYAVPFAEIGIADTGTVGGKGASLGELTRVGVPVPGGFVLTTAAFREAMATIDPGGEQRARVAALDPGDLDTVGRVAGRLRQRIEQAPLPEPLGRAALAGYRALAPGGDCPVAVRSSATSEDGLDASFAGLQDSYLWVRGEEPLLGYVRRCWASLYSVESVSYRLRRQLPEDGLAMAVVIQRMVDPRCAGVLFTRSPLTGDRSVVVVEAVWGLGSALVSGDVTPDRFTVHKVTGEIGERAVSRKLRRHRLDPAGAGVSEQDVPAELQEVSCLSDEQIGALAGVGKRIEKHYGAPQDIEWAIAGGEISVLQSRPETVWAQRDAAPVAAPRTRALDHVLERLGGMDRVPGGAPGAAT